MEYKIIQTLSEKMIFRVSDSAWIPMTESNADYQRYLEWLEING